MAIEQATGLIPPRTKRVKVTGYGFRVSGFNNTDSFPLYAKLET